MQDAPILKVMVNMHVRNKYTKPNGRRFTELEKDICAYQYLNSGKGHYTFWGRNMINISSKTLQTHIKENTLDITEGIINVAGLKEYLIKNNFPLVVMLCEDGTRITPAVQYDYRTDGLRGLVAPLDDITGLPEQGTFVASSPTKMADDIKTHRVANYGYVQVAVPLCKGAAPFVLFHMCTDNRFTTDDVLNRWKYEETLLAMEKIQVVANAADGDNRVVKGQKIRAGFNKERSSKWGEWFIVNDDPVDPLNFQDDTHTLNKMKNRLAHTEKQLDLQIGNLEISNIVICNINTFEHILGDFIITTEHLKVLVEKVGKDKHTLTMADIVTKDRMKFGPTLKFIRDETIQCLEDHVPGSDGTVLYLKTMRRLYRSLMVEDLTPLERVFEIWLENIFFFS